MLDGRRVVTARGSRTVRTWRDEETIEVEKRDGSWGDVRWGNGVRQAQTAPGVMDDGVEGRR